MKSNRPPCVLICDDDSLFHLAVKQALKGRYECRSAYHSDEALAVLRNHPVDVVLLDVQMRTTDEGLKAIPKILDCDRDQAIVMSSGLTDFQTVREAMRLGAVDYVPKDFDPNRLEHVLKRVLERRVLLRRKEQQNFETASHQKKHVLIGDSPNIQALRKLIDRIRKSEANVVITGETGTGKEVVARLLRKTLPDGTLAPLVAVDSSTIQSATAESILFGHEKGAFTGAEKTTKGIFEEADGGAVYFDEIANMPLEIQAKLLRVIQEKEISRLGSPKVIPLEFRIICATNRNLEELVRTGQFKDDLLQRLNVLPVELAPLRERKEDIPALVEHFLQRDPGAQGLSFTGPALQALQDYPWPGNVRELANLISYLAATTDCPEVDLCDLSPKFRDAARNGARVVPASTSSDDKRLDFYETVSRFEKELLATEYAKTAGNVSRLALQLGMDRSHLHSKLKEYDIHKSGRA